jgi:hypothetical protein
VREFIAINGDPDIIFVDHVFPTAREAMAREQELQRRYNVRYNESFLNKAIAGIFDFSDPEIRRKMSEAKKGTKHSPEWIEWVTGFHRTRPRSAETNARISAALTGKKLSEEHRAKCSRGRKGKPSPRKGVILSKEQRERMRLARLGTKHSEATRQKMSEFRKGKKFKIVECPHCKKSGGESGMRSWHFEHCKIIRS